MSGIEQRLKATEDAMVDFLQKLIQIPSVRAEAAGPGAPFGENLRKALETVLAWGEQEGFRTRNVRGYAGHIEYGEGDATVGVLVHLDVVPAGEGWTYPPFAAVIEDGRIYGRGAVDDKGPTAAVLFALKALKDQGVPLRRKIRVIFGCDEESNWECMEEYFKVEPRPAMGFTPDADFPLVYSEKGMLAVALTGSLPAGDAPVCLEAVTGGMRRNIVPEYAEAVLGFTDPSLRESVRQKLQAAGEEIGHIQLEGAGDTLKIKATGRAAHASQPQLGENAIGRLVLALNSLELSGGPWEFIRLLAEDIGLTYDGSGLNIAANHPTAGPLTLNLGRIRKTDDEYLVELDLRYPPSVTGDELLGRLRERFAVVGLAVREQKHMPPHYVDPEHELVATLLETYRQLTGDNRPPLAIGGRTYATTLGTAVAFGPNFPGRSELAHQKDEYISLADLAICARIYARALATLAG